MKFGINNPLGFGKYQGFSLKQIVKFDYKYFEYISDRLKASFDFDKEIFTLINQEKRKEEEKFELWRKAKVSRN